MAQTSFHQEKLSGLSAVERKAVDRATAHFNLKGLHDLNDVFDERYRGNCEEAILHDNELAKTVHSKAMEAFFSLGSSKTESLNNALENAEQIKDDIVKAAYTEFALEVAEEKGIGIDNLDYSETELARCYVDSSNHELYEAAST